MNNTLDTILRFYNPEIVGLIYCLESDLNQESEDYFNLFYLTNGLIKNHVELEQKENPLIITKFFKHDTFIKILHVKDLSNLAKIITALQKSIPQIFQDKKTILIRASNGTNQKKIELEMKPALKNLNIEIKLII